MIILHNRKFTRTRLSPILLADAFVVSPSRRRAEKDFCDDFMYLFNSYEMSKETPMREVANVSFSRSPHKHTLRGIHYQLPPYTQAKLVSCIRGAAQYIIVDLRPRSPTFKGHYSIVLRPQDCMLYAPEGFAHGFLSLTDDSEILYMEDRFYGPGNERGIRYDDPEFNLPWQAKPVIISDEDQNWRSFSPNWHLKNMEIIPAGKTSR